MRRTPDRQRSRLGVLGGTFDPVHIGHLSMALAAVRERSLDRVLLVPAHQPPHKESPEADGAHRLEMLRLATRDQPRLEPSDIELRRGGVSYTVDTLEELRRELPEAEIFFIVGADSVADLPRWRRIERILELARVLTLARDGDLPHFGAADFPGVPAEILERCERDRLAARPPRVASREIRRAIREHRPFESAVTPRVAMYIREHRLYGYRDG